MKGGKDPIGDREAPKWGGLTHLPFSKKKGKQVRLKPEDRERIKKGTQVLEKKKD